MRHPRERASGKVISLMEALRRSIEGDTARRPASKSTADARRKTASRRSVGVRLVKLA